MKPAFLLTVISLLFCPTAMRAAEPLPVLVLECAGKSPNDFGARKHTFLRYLDRTNAKAANTAQFNTPVTIRSVYNIPTTGGSGAIALVDAYHYPTALNDFNGFSAQYGLPKETSTNATSSANLAFQVVYATGRAPQSGGKYIAGWNLEEALDMEWAHAIAPKAKIYVVEAASDSTSDLNYAVQVAASLPGVKEVSMSWGGNETSIETSSDAIYSHPGVVFVASGGDTGAAIEYPASSPNVIAAGGTSINRSSTGAFLSETGWSDMGCGVSRFEPRPAFQNAIASIVGTKRGVCDLSFLADPNTGVYVYDTTPVWGTTGWQVIGGTSLSSPSIAGMINLAATTKGFAASSQVENARIYGALGNASAFRDITSGTAGRFRCAVGWDYLTGVGSPISFLGL